MLSETCKCRSLLRPFSSRAAGGTSECSGSLGLGGKHSSGPQPTSRPAPPPGPSSAKVGRGGRGPAAGTREIMAVKSGLEQGSAHFFYKEEDSEYFRLCRPQGLCHNY